MDRREEWRAYHHANKDLINAEKRERRATVEDREKRKAYVASRRERSREWLNAYRHSESGCLRRVLKVSRATARAKGWDHDLDWDWLSEEYAAQGGRCALTGVEFVFDKPQKGYRRPFAPSIDRIDPRKGYVKSNCRIVCAALNIAINDWGEDVFAALAYGYIKRAFP